MHIEFGNPDVSFLAELYAREGVEARPVGGAVRDCVIGEQPKDFDFAVDALPDEVMAIAERRGLKVVPTGLKHGTVTVVLNGVGYEFTTLRTDLETDGRWAEVSFVKDFKLDADRRDFTFNAMSADHKGLVHDYFDGISDLQAGRVRFVGDASSRVKEDYLRILRFFRFRSRFGNSDHDHLDSILAIRKHAEGLQLVSVERIWKETSQIMASQRGAIQLVSMETLGVTHAIGLPFFVQGVGSYQKLRHHTADPAILLGSLFSDPGEAELFASQWRLSNTERQRCVAAAETMSDRTSDPHYWCCKQVDGFPADVAQAVLAATDRKEAAAALLEAAPKFPLQARDLLAAGFKPGPALGAEIKRLDQAWKDSRFELAKDQLIEMACNRVVEEEEPTWRLK